MESPSKGALPTCEWCAGRKSRAFQSTPIPVNILLFLLVDRLTHKFRSLRPGQHGRARSAAGVSSPLRPRWVEAAPGEEGPGPARCAPETAVPPGYPEPTAKGS